MSNGGIELPQALNNTGYEVIDPSKQVSACKRKSELILSQQQKFEETEVLSKETIAGNSNQDELEKATYLDSCFEEEARLARSFNVTKKKPSKQDIQEMEIHLVNV